MTSPNLSIRIGSLAMRTPVTVGSGTFGFGSETPIPERSQPDAKTLEGFEVQVHRPRTELIAAR